MSIAPAILAVDELLARAVRAGASDIHLNPDADSMSCRLRVDGLLGSVTSIPTELGKAMVARLMVLSKLLTYRQDIPQEGKASIRVDDRSIDLRVAVIPSLRGLRCAVRLPSRDDVSLDLPRLGLDESTTRFIERFSRTDAGMLVVVGPAGSGKTTTIYSVLRHIQSTRPDLSIVSIEDPIERELPGITQIEVRSVGEFTYERALRSILRQDPQVLALGEIRDADTAALALNASLSGHRLVCTLHASSPAGAIARLIEMGIEPYRITSGLFGVINQRLLRRLEGGQFAGRIVVAEHVELSPTLRKTILAGGDIDALDAACRQAGTAGILDRARELAGTGQTSVSEIERIFGLQPAVDT
jgi:type II secretory ATPase GspE/PulE/Tfp pilus assembly ATPase PilB-like protein